MTEVEDFLEHHGVLGMKWGVRKDRGHRGERATTKQIARLDKKFERPLNYKQNVSFRSTAGLVYQKSDLPRINNKAKYQNKDFHDPANAALAKQYYREHGDAYEMRLNEAVKTLGTNASGTKEYKVIIPDKSDVSLFTDWYVTTAEVKHDDDSFYVHVQSDDRGVVRGLDTPTETLSHATVSDFLEHHGVLGMKWGVRKDNSRNPNYTDNQRARDKQVYGRRGVNRVNKALNSGRSISVARGDEKTKRDQVLGRNKYVRPAGKTIGALGGVALANVAISALRNHRNQDRIIRFILKRTGGNVSKASEIYKPIGTAIYALSSPKGRLAVSAGAAYVGNLLGGDIAVNINTSAGGYDPRRKA